MELPQSAEQVPMLTVSNLVFQSEDSSKPQLTSLIPSQR